MPSAAIVLNQTTITGPKSLPISPVPRRWIAKSATRMAQVSGTTRCDSRGLTFASPSTALRTEIAGVITPSPYSSEAPITARSAMPVTLPLCLACDAEAFGDDRQQRENPPFTVVVGTHDEGQVLDRDHHDQRPEHQREDAEQIGGTRPVFWPPVASRHSFRV